MGYLDRHWKVRVPSPFRMLATSRPLLTPVRFDGTRRSMSTIALSSGRSRQGHQAGAKSGSDNDETIGPAVGVPAPWVWKEKAPKFTLGGVPPYTTVMSMSSPVS